MTHIPIDLPSQSVHIHAQRELAFEVISSFGAGGTAGGPAAGKPGPANVVLEEERDRMLVEFRSRVNIGPLSTTWKTTEWVSPNRPESISFELVQSVEFRRLRTMLDDVGKIAEGALIVTTAGKDDEVVLDSKEALLAYLMESGKRGLSIQRYKGLGEMNATQLWETTLDPDKRTLLQVSQDDAADADRVFTVLMGDLVEPRKNFIQAHALEVKNLDV